MFVFVFFLMRKSVCVFVWVHVCVSLFMFLLVLKIIDARTSRKVQNRKKNGECCIALNLLIFDQSLKKTQPVSQSGES